MIGTQKPTEGTGLIHPTFRRKPMAKVTYRGVVYDTENKTTCNKVTSDLIYRGIKHQEERLVCAK